MKHSLYRWLEIVIFVGGFAVSSSREIRAQALNMDGQSGVFFQPWAEVVPSAHNRWGRPTVAFHTVTAGPVAGDYQNVAIEEGFGGWLEIGFVRSNHTDGGDPTLSPLFNFAGMNIFNVKSKLLPANFHGHKELPSLSVGGVLRTNDPFVSQKLNHTNGTNGDVYAVATKFVNITHIFSILANVGVRATNAQKYGYGGNTDNWEARAFGAVAFPIPVRKMLLVSPTFEIDQEPRQIKFVPGATMPTDLIYAVRLSHLPDSKWSFDIGTGHVGARLAPGINIKANNALAFAADYRF
jgi:hypothetical protein